MAIRLSFDKFQVKQIAAICDVTMETVYSWFDNWEKDGVDSLLVAPGQGRKTLIKSSEHDKVLKIVDENSKQLKTALAKVEERLGKTISIYTLKSIIRKKSWRHGRKSLKEKRNYEQFRKFKAETNMLEQDEKGSMICLLYYFFWSILNHESITNQYLFINNVAGLKYIVIFNSAFVFYNLHGRFICRNENCNSHDYGLLDRVSYKSVVPAGLFFWQQPERLFGQRKIY